MNSVLTALAASLICITLQVEAKAPLERDPARLPKSEAEAWIEWTPTGKPPEGLQPVIAEMARAYRAGELPQALGQILDGLKLAPDYPPLLHQGGVIYFKLRRYEDSRELFERFVRVAPGLVQQTRALGHCYYTLGDYESALKHYERVLAQAPEMIEARRGFALALMRTGDADSALRELREVVERAPDHADAWVWIAQIQFDEDLAKEAQKTLEEALKWDAHAPRAWFLKAQVAWELGLDEEGDAAHDRYRQLDRVAQEVRALEARLNLDPHQVDLLMRIFEAHRTVGNQAGLRRAGARLIRERSADNALRIHVLDGLIEVQDLEAPQAGALAPESVAEDDPAAWKRLEHFWDQVGNRQKRTEAAERYLRLKYR